MKLHPVILIAISLVLFLTLYAFHLVKFSVVVLSPLIGVTVYIVVDIVLEVLRGGKRE
jgi:hypothetical protein